MTERKEKVRIICAPDLVIPEIEEGTGSKDKLQPDQDQILVQGERENEVQRGSVRDWVKQGIRQRKKNIILENMLVEALDVDRVQDQEGLMKVHQNKVQVDEELCLDPGIDLISPRNLKTTIQLKTCWFKLQILKRLHWNFSEIL